jgi:hypothetical protein
MIGLRLSNPAASDDMDHLIAMYRRLASMDPPALRSLAGELQRMSDESLASASLRPGPAAQGRAGRDAQRAAAAQAALAAVESDVRAAGA